MKIKEQPILAGAIDLTNLKIKNQVAREKKLVAEVILIGNSLIHNQSQISSNKNASTGTIQALEDIKSGLSIRRENTKRGLEKTRQTIVTYKEQLAEDCIGLLKAGQKIESKSLSSFSFKDMHTNLIVAVSNSINKTQKILKKRKDEKLPILRSINSTLVKIGTDGLQNKDDCKKQMENLTAKLQLLVNLDKKRHPIMKFLFKKSRTTSAVEKIIKSTKHAVNSYQHEKKEYIQNLQMYNTFAKK
jgi:hypothetical protein